MKASELVKKLESAISAEGDLDVMVSFDRGFDSAEVRSVETDFDCGGDRVIFIETLQ